MKKFSWAIVLCFLLAGLQAYELESFLGAPTAGLLQRGQTKIETKLYRENGLLLGAKVGLFPRFMFGVSFGGEQVVGNEKPIWHERVEFNAKFRIMDEGPQLPAVCIGFDSQGHGAYDKGMERYDIKSKGFYAVASRNYFFLGNIGFHAGVNYTLEKKDEKELNFFLGLDKNIGKVVILVAEYDLALNDNDEREETAEFSGAGKGYLNAGLRVEFTKQLTLSVLAYDLLENSPTTISLDRAVKISYKMKF